MRDAQGERTRTDAYYVRMREYHRKHLQYRPPAPPRRDGKSLWFPAKMMALGFVTVLASMMVIPSLKLFYPAVLALFVFAGALNMAIVLPLAMMIIRGKGDEPRRKRLIGHE